MLTVSTHGPAVVMKVAGDVDVVDVVALRNAIARLIEDTTACRVVVDVSQAHHLGPRGLATLVDEKALLMRRGGDLALVLGAASEAEAWGLGRLFDLHASVEDALERLGA